MSCARHAWLEVGRVLRTITVECPECGSTAVVDRDGALLVGPFLQAVMPAVVSAAARPVQLAFAL